MYRHMRNISWLFLAGLNLSCHMDGYHELGEPINRFTQLGPDASTYMRTSQSEAGPSVELLTFSDLREAFGSCVAMRVTDHGDKVCVVMDLGTYQSWTDEMELAYGYRYINIYVPTSNPSGVTGAIQEKLSPERQETYTWIHDRSSGTLQVGGIRYRNIACVFDTILSQNSADWPDQFIKMFLLCTMAAHTRIEGFGGAGMLQYIGKTTAFNGLVSGKMFFSVQGLTELISTFNYISHCDVACVILDGEIINQSNLKGTGTMNGGLSFTVACPKNTWEGYVNYSDIRIAETLPNAGNYRLTFTQSDTMYTASYDYGNPGRFDLTDVLNPDPEKW